ncbi:MAG: hypothetical protein AB1600_03330 [Bacteroidota bacterium]
MSTEKQTCQHDEQRQHEKQLHLHQLVELLQEINRHKKPRKIEINFDGYMFKTWNVTVWKPTADDFRRDDDDVNSS